MKLVSGVGGLRERGKGRGVYIIIGGQIFILGMINHELGPADPIHLRCNFNLNWAPTR